MKPAHWQLYLISFVEGASLMAVELIGAKLASPHFGSSIIVWASALGFTLMGLMAGYFTGGWLSVRRPSPRLLYGVVLASGLLVAFMPLTASIAGAITGSMSLRPAVFLSEFLILFPPVMLFGIVSPMVIRLITRTVAEAGSSAGRIYTLSTVGGIVLNFAVGLYCIPYWGVTASALAVGLFLSLPSAILLFLTKPAPSPDPA